MSQPKDAKRSDQNQIVALVEARLRKLPEAVSAARIRDLIKKDLQTDISAVALEALLKQESTRSHSSIRVKSHGTLQTFFIGQENVRMDDPGEKALYKPFAALLERKGFRAKPLDHTRAVKGKSGENLWRYPDIIGYRTTTVQPDLKRLAERTGVKHQDNLVGFELKLELRPGSIRSAFFQCLANSYWANQRYVVAPAVDIEHEAHEIFHDLSQHFDVGLIEIVWGDDRLRDMENYRVVVECKRSEIDLGALQTLRKSWVDLDEFITQLAL
ncbi:MAG: hypothetical protein JNM27_10700 [Leptospirales bacterium]|nr:hypothetical protein [Leptospirales bacterium]